MKEIVFLNGKFVPKEEAKISVLGPAFLYGWGLFETMRAYNNKIVYLEAHLERIKKSSRLIDIRMRYSLAGLKDIIFRTIKVNSFKDAYVRLTLWKSKKGADILVVAKKYLPLSSKKYKEGFAAAISKFRQNEGAFLAQVKSTSRLLYESAYQEAKNKGFDEAIILNHRGYITEGSRSNIFLVKESVLFTPALECGCLEGVTRKAIFDFGKKYKIKVYEGNFTVQDLYIADEVFLTNSLMGVMPLTSLEKQPLAKGLVGKLTKFFMQKYNVLLKNGT